MAVNHPNHRHFPTSFNNLHSNIPHIRIAILAVDCDVRQTRMEISLFPLVCPKRNFVDPNHLWTQQDKRHMKHDLMKSGPFVDDLLIPKYKRKRRRLLHWKP
eukprot:g17869.t1